MANVEFLRRKSEAPDKAIAVIENLKTRLGIIRIMKIMDFWI
jgi:hypothetical protein